MDLATGAMGSLLPKLVELVSDEYKLQKGVKEGVKSLEKEMRSMQAALCKVGEVPRDQLDGQLKLWAGEVRELSFDIEDVVDKFLVRVDDDSETSTKSSKLRRLTKKMAGLFTKGKARHEIADAIKDIKKQVQEVADRRGRYNLDNIVGAPAAVSTIDPRLRALYTEVIDLVGITGKRDQELMRLLSEGNSETMNELKIVSVVGFGGLGKTTLVKTVYDKIKGDFEQKAFVPVGRNADVKKVLMDILIDLGIKRSHLTGYDERQLIDKLRGSLENNRYLIVIDDMWDGKLWDVIKLSFPKSNNLRSRIITTTRIVSVSKLCCSSANDSVYQMEPLSDDDSKRLFYKRIFSNESECPREFEEVSLDILKKCGGVPLAIITIASVLASDQRANIVYEWHALLESIGHGLTEDQSVEEMLRVLSFSYYDLPSHMKTCLLYLSMFPEDYKIGKARLIWMWIAEKFVQFEKAGSTSRTSLFEIGETYFNELVNRNLIMPVYDPDGCTVIACQVHDMILDLITSLSSEGNFVSVLNGTGNAMSSQRNARRLSLQNARKVELQTKPLESAGMFQVRYVAAFGHGIELMPSFLSFVVLRVLDLNGSYLGDHSQLNLGDLGSILHLRYLGLANTQITKVPEQVGKLQFLEVLDLSGNYDLELPSTIINLKRLMCLLINYDHKRLPDGLGNLASMEVLSGIRCDSLRIVKELGNMERLRELSIQFDILKLEEEDEEEEPPQRRPVLVKPTMEEAFVECLGKLSVIQSLEICDNRWKAMDILGERWTPPTSLKEFRSHGDTLFSTLPAWIKSDPSYLSQLSKLSIKVEGARQEDLDILGRLPALGSLRLCYRCWSGLLLVGADGFPRLVSFFLDSLLTWGRIMFQPGAMPKAEIVELRIDLETPWSYVQKGEAVRNMGMGNLMSLRKVNATISHFQWRRRDASQATAALVNALKIHPNHPTFDIVFYPDFDQMAPRFVSHAPAWKKRYG